MLFLLIITNVILAAIAGTFAIRNVFINYKESKSKFKNTFFIISLIITLYLILSGGAYAIFLDSDITQLQSKLSIADSETVIGHDGAVINQSEEIREQLRTLKNQEPKVALYSALGFLFLVCSWQLRKNIIKEIAETKTNGTWNL